LIYDLFLNIGSDVACYVGCSLICTCNHTTNI